MNKCYRYVWYCQSVCATVCSIHWDGLAHVIIINNSESEIIGSFPIFIHIDRVAAVLARMMRVHSPTQYSQQQYSIQWENHQLIFFFSWTIFFFIPFLKQIIVNNFKWNRYAFIIFFFLLLFFQKILRECWIFIRAFFFFFFFFISNSKSVI